MRMTKAQLVDENIALRHNISLLEQQLASLRAAPQPKVQRPATEEQIVSTYTKRDGSRWNKIRIGYNTFVHRPARVFHVVAVSMTAMRRTASSLTCATRSRKQRRCC